MNLIKNRICCKYRDKIQSRFVQLLAQIAINDNLISPLEVDESSSNAAPGKILDAFTMHEVLKRPAEEHVYYGQGMYRMS